jgi:hypothetical protein
MPCIQEGFKRFKELAINSVLAMRVLHLGDKEYLLPVVGKIEQ